MYLQPQAFVEAVRFHVFMILSSSWSRLSVQLLITFAKKLWNSSLTISASSSKFVCTHVTLDIDEAVQQMKHFLNDIHNDCFQSTLAFVIFL